MQQKLIWLHFQRGNNKLLRKNRLRLNYLLIISYLLFYIFLNLPITNFDFHSILIDSPNQVFSLNQSERSLIPTKFSTRINQSLERLESKIQFGSISFKLGHQFEFILKTWFGFIPFEADFSKLNLLSESFRPRIHSDWCSGLKQNESDYAELIYGPFLSNEIQSIFRIS